MSIATVLLQDFDHEMRGTRRTLERIPDAIPAWKPHGRSMAMGRLAAHVATLPQLATLILTREAVEAPGPDWPPNLNFVSTPRLLEDFDRIAGRAREALTGATDEQLGGRWQFFWAGHKALDDVCSVLYRTAFFNHLLHHRAQLGVYLRLNDLAVPALYGPSADEPF